MIYVQGIKRRTYIHNVKKCFEKIKIVSSIALIIKMFEFLCFNHRHTIGHQCFVTIPLIHYTLQTMLV